MPSSTPVVRRESAAAAVGALVKWMRARSAARPPQLLGDESDDLLYLAAAAALAGARALSLPVADAIPLSALRSDFKPFEARRRLCASHDLFVADRRVLPLLPRLLGKSFFRKKKNPLPLDLSRPGWPLQLRRLLRSTFLYLRSGTCCAVKVGRLYMDPDLVVDNVLAVADAAAARLPRKWANVRSLHVKAVDSVALPIYQVVPEPGLKIDVSGMDDKEEQDDAVNKEEEEEEEVEGKKRKRAKKGASLELETGKERRTKKKKKGTSRSNGEDNANADEANYDIAGDERGADEQKPKEKKKIKKSTKRKDEPVLDDALATAGELKKKKKKRIKTEKAGDIKVKRTRIKAAA
ncbi:Ribosomal L1 domain-containing protein 1 [Ananas comosus]|uniref:Ribosomal L1 domain-containing protein 1 n=1 Tax=Ananas comosus TaxID=4615 RepID=A0A199UHC6_ANACO|nr:Ribosomal L1 domain-containing protein 1 [Ananas comosus]